MDDVLANLRPNSTLSSHALIDGRRSKFPGKCRMKGYLNRNSGELERPRPTEQIAGDIYELLRGDTNLGFCEQSSKERSTSR